MFQDIGQDMITCWKKELKRLTTWYIYSLYDHDGVIIKWQFTERDNNVSFSERQVWEREKRDYLGSKDKGHW